MAKRFTSIDRRAVQSAQSARQQANRLSSRLQSLRSGGEGLTGRITTPDVTPKRKTIKRTTTPGWLDTLFSFYSSDAQAASELLSALNTAARIK